MKKRVGILGGTFNPPHIGHLCLAYEMMDRLSLAKVIFIPSWQTPLKKRLAISPHHRLNMVKYLVKDEPHFEVSRFEINQKRKVFSYETVDYLERLLGKKNKLFFIIGSDCVDHLEKWKNFKQLIQKADLVVGCRHKNSRYADRKGIKFINTRYIDISSTDIRHRAKKQKPISYLTKKKVADYICCHKLYMGTK